MHTSCGASGMVKKGLRLKAHHTSATNGASSGDGIEGSSGCACAKQRCGAPYRL